MKILRKDLKEGSVQVRVSTADDLWHLSALIEAGDMVFGETERKVKMGTGDKTTAVRKTYHLTLLVEKLSYDDGATELRILGTNQTELDDIPKGSHHTIEARLGSILTIMKKRWLSYHLERLEDAAAEVHSDILVCLLDRESAIIALLKSHGYEVLVEINGEVAKKYPGSSSAKEFYPEVAKKLHEYDARYSLSSIVVASPAFWKEEILKHISDKKLLAKIRTATINTVDRSGLDELLRRPELSSILASDRVAKEALVMEDLLKEIAGDGLCAYGETDVSKTAEMGAVKTLLISTGFIATKRAEESFERIDSLMKKIDSSSGKIRVLNSKNEPGKRLDALGGIAALLRFRANW